MKSTNNILSILLIITLAISATTKLINHDRTVTDMMIQAFPIGWAKYLAWIQPILQVIICALLLSPKSNHIGLFIASGYFLLLIIYSATVLAKLYQYEPCSCIGLFRGISWFWTLVLHNFLLLLTLLAYFNRPSWGWLKSLFTRKERRLNKQVVH